jgi:hypothetical protein
MEEQVRWHVGQRAQARQGAGSLEQPSQTDVCGSGSLENAAIKDVLSRKL